MSLEEPFKTRDRRKGRYTVSLLITISVVQTGVAITGETRHRLLVHVLFRLQRKDFVR
jgi:hypothetical protein